MTYAAHVTSDVMKFANALSRDKVADEFLVGSRFWGFRRNTMVKNDRDFFWIPNFGFGGSAFIDFAKAIDDESSIFVRHREIDFWLEDISWFYGRLP